MTKSKTHLSLAEIGRLAPLVESWQFDYTEMTDRQHQRCYTGRVSGLQLVLEWDYITKTPHVVSDEDYRVTAHVLKTEGCVGDYSTIKRPRSTLVKKEKLEEIYDLVSGLRSNERTKMQTMPPTKASRINEGTVARARKLISRKK
jgi:hypothetical protein